MCKRRGSRFFLIGALLLAATTTSYAQSPATQSEQEQRALDALNARVDAASVTLQKITSSRLTVGLFLDDKALDAKITLPPKPYSGSFLLSKLHRTTRRWVSSEDVEPVVNRVFVAGENVSSRAVMDAWASLHAHRWRRINPTEYHLIRSSGSEAFGFGPNSKSEAEVFALGEEFFKSLDALPSDVKGRFLPSAGTAQQPSQGYAPVGDLPAEMQQLLKRMADTVFESHRAGMRLENFSLPTDQMADWGVRIKPEPGLDFQGYTITLNHPRSQVGFRVNLPQSSARPASGKSSRGSKTNGTPDVTPDTYVPERLEKPTTQDTALAKQVVLVEAENASLLDVLQKLSTSYNIPLLTNVDLTPELKTRKQDVSLRAVSLSQALDALAKQYRTPTLKIEWDLRKQGFLVVRAVPQRTADAKP